MSSPTNDTIRYDMRKEYFASEKYIYSVQGFLIIVINLGLIILIATKKKLREVKANIFLANLNACHLTVGSVALIYSAFGRKFIWESPELFKSINALYHVASILASFANVLITLDRLLAIKWPFLYQYTVTTRKYFILCLLEWSLGVAMLLVVRYLPGSNVESLDAVLITLSLIVILFLGISNILIFKIARKHALAMRKVVNVPQYSRKVSNARETSVNNIAEIDQCAIVNLETEPNSADNEIKDANNGRQKNQNRAFIRDKVFIRSAYVCTGIVVSYVTFGFPHVLHDVLSFVDGVEFNQDDKEFFMITFVLVYFNSIIDPIICVTLNPLVKKELKKVYKAIFKRQ